MSGPTFRRYDPAADEDQLVAFLSSHRWPFHVVADMTAEAARDQLGDYREGSATWWVEVGGEVAGFVRMVFEEGGDPWLDIRLGEPWRGRGLGRKAIVYAVGAVFGEHGDVHRIEASARRDNVASRRTLRACGFVKEAVYRRAYEPYVHEPLDGIGYALLRRDWESGTSTPVDWDEEP